MRSQWRRPCGGRRSPSQPGDAARNRLVAAWVHDPDRLGITWVMCRFYEGLRRYGARMRVSSSAAAIAVAACLVTGCTSQGTQPLNGGGGVGAGAAPSVSPAAPATPVWTARIISATPVATGPKKVDETGDLSVWSKPIEAGFTLVTVKWAVTNPSGTPVPWPSPNLLYGPNLMPAEWDSGWAGQKRLQAPQAPGQVGAGQSVTWWASWRVETAQMGDLRLQLMSDGLGESPVVVPFRMK
jgi:hypothetical protein